MKTTQIANQLTVAEIVEKRDQILSLYDHGFDSINKAINISLEISSYSAIPIRHFPSKAEVKKQVDCKVWRYLFEVSGMSQVMNAKQKEDFDKMVVDNPPEITVDTVKSTLITNHMDKDNIFLEGMINTFEKLDRKYKSNKVFKLNKRVIFTALNGWGMYSHNALDNMIDLERIIYIVNKLPPPNPTVKNGIYHSIGKQDLTEFKFFKVKTFKNGNAHLEITCSGTLSKINDLIAEYYGSGLADKNKF